MQTIPDAGHVGRDFVAMPSTRLYATLILHRSRPADPVYAGGVSLWPLMKRQKEWYRIRQRYNIAAIISEGRQPMAWQNHVPDNEKPS